MSKKIQFMRDTDIIAVSDNIDNIMKKARAKEIQLIEPFFDEFIAVRSIILNYIKKEKRIIYGGYAWNNLIKNVSPDDVFYSDTDYTDIEFYSNKPIEDMKNICDIISDKGYKFIQGKSAQHDDTYTIFVNFTGYCDISYMPSNIFYSCMTENIDGYRLIHPKFIMIDILRMLTDPITSYWRLDKAHRRGKLMIKHFPFEFKNQSSIVESVLKPKTSELINEIFEQITSMSTILFAGSIALNAFFNPVVDINQQITVYDNKSLELISVNLAEDVKQIYQIILKYFMDNNKLDTFNDHILLEQYYPFFQFTDRKAIFKYDGDIFITIYGNNEKCIPYNDLKLKYNNLNISIHCPTFNWIFMLYLIKFHQAYADKERDKQMLYNSIMSNLLIQRDNFLESNKLTVLNETIFEDFKITCLGNPVSPMRKFMLSRRDKKLMSKSAIFPYDPDERRDNYSLDIYNFHNYSGNIINNPKDFIYNINKNKINNFITNENSELNN